MYNYLNLLPLWNPTDYQRKLILPLIFLILGFIFLASTLTSFMKTTGLIQVINLVISTIFVIYLLGRIYGELNVKKDYINISKHGIEFRETPGLSQGWLPVTKSIAFDQVKSIDIIQIKNVFNSNSENMAIYLQPVKGKAIVMGSKLNKDRKSTRLNSSHTDISRMPSSA